MNELEEFKKIVSPIAYGLAYKSKLGTTEYQQLYAEEDVIKYFNNKPQLTIPKSIADELEDNGLDSYVIYSSLPSNSYLIPEWEPLVDLSDNLIKWCETTEKWWAILDAYLAGKALGVDLVKVVEG